MEPKNWTQVNIYNKNNYLLYSFILNAQDILELNKAMQKELSTQELGAYAISYHWEDIGEDGDAPLFPCYGIEPGAYRYKMSELF